MNSYYDQELPLCRAWERVAAKELAEILHGCCTHGFDTPMEVANRLADLECYLREIEAGRCQEPSQAKLIYQDIMNELGVKPMEKNV